MKQPVASTSAPSGATRSKNVSKAEAIAKRQAEGCTSASSVQNSAANANAPEWIGNRSTAKAKSAPQAKRAFRSCLNNIADTYDDIEL